MQTPVGLARYVLEGTGAGLVVLGHGAGGGIESLDLLAARDAALACGLRVARVEQPWRVKGRRVAEAPVRLDAAWTAVLAGLDGDPLVLGGRSAGARVACRTAGVLGADAVLCLAFPLVTPKGVSREHELAGVQVPLLVVQGERDPFGVPAGAVTFPGTHAFPPSSAPLVAAAVAEWLQTLT